MPSDSLSLADYMLLARELTSLVNPRIRGRNGQKAHTPPKYTPKDEIMLMEHLNEREAL